MSKLEETFLGALEQNQQRLIRICSVYAKDAEDRKDLFQEVLVTIWQSMPSFQGKSSIGTWMYRITLNVCLGLQSRATKHRSRFIHMDSEAIGNIGGGDRVPEPHPRLDGLRSCIDKLNDADKAIIMLYLEELPYKDISDITGLSENNVAVKVMRIKTRLFNCLK
ncbi:MULTISPECIES: RNA polymerase sigma factor [unclassified Imperialibacter]|uniref:RNA polymerase sigma factor n=1 Tax=unclassified Imperialibacter TaxID=2629706 RepID=UPI001257C3E0|nr:MULTISPECIES: sigma-70 family RNA polymerase sigma factor [unclassified Imperialibacter]CAD5276843.1 ECF RNA polymerase sigma factor SigG [Imperialibacter sp. 89]CAD5295201.1 ECF RNA polymerase sigma factor SigG [Imperialibacter sp. 75]VVT29125.1 ECF RNA polymerase sigma factor SigG [Imperialibacter sp. EC-SDR9]